MNASTALKALALPVVLTVAVASAFAADANFDRTLTVSGSPTVSVSTGSGSIQMHPGSGSQIHIIGHIHANNGWPLGSGDIDARIARIAANPPITQSGNQVTIGERHSDDDLYRNIAIDYDITLPATSAITASSGSGSLDLEGVGSTLKANSGSGTIRAHGVRGPANLQTGSGAIDLDETAAGDIHAQTGSGTIRINGISGGLYARTGSGSIEATGKPTSEWKLDTGSGAIHLTVGSAPFTLNASTGSGVIHVTQPISMQGDLNRHHVTAAVNGGGPTIATSTGSGDIRIQ